MSEAINAIGFLYIIYLILKHFFGAQIKLIFSIILTLSLIELTNSFIENVGNSPIIFSLLLIVGTFVLIKNRKLSLNKSSQPTTQITNSIRIENEQKNKWNIVSY